MKWKLALAAASVVAFLYLSLAYRRLTWMGDDGFFLEGANRIVGGQTIYRDFWTYFTPGSYYALIAAWTVLGQGWETARILWLVLVLVQATAVFFLVHALTRSTPFGLTGYFLIVARAIVNPVYNHHHLSTTLAFISLMAWWGWLRSYRLPYALLGGLGDSLVFWVSQNKGLLLAGASLLILLALSSVPWKRKIGALLGYTIGCTLSSISPILFLIGSGTWGNFLHNCFLFLAGAGYLPFSNVPYGTCYADADQASTGLALARWWTTSWYIYSPLVALPIELFLFLRGSSRNIHRSFLMIQGWALWGAALHRPDIDHLFYVVHIPTVLLLTQLYTLSRLQPNIPIPWKRWIGTGTRVFLGLVAMTTAGAMLARTYHVFVRPQFLIQTPRDRPWTWSEDLAKTINTLVPHLANRIRPGEPIFVYPHSSLYYSFLQTTNPTRYDILFEGYLSKQQIAEAIDTLNQRKVRYILVDAMWEKTWSQYLYPKAGLDFSRGMLMDFVRSRYEPELVLPTAALYRRKE